MTEVKMFCAKGDKNFETRSFGLYYEVYKSTYVYGTKDDIEKFIKYANVIGYLRAVEKLKPTKEEIKWAKEEAVIEMKRIASSYGLDIVENDYDVITNKYFDHSDYFVGVKYFDKYMQGRILHNKLIELEV